MQTKKSITLPTQLECYRHKIESSIVNSLWITPVKEKPSITDSKFSGSPYLPKSHIHPKDSNGDYMPLLAQINFAQLLSPSLFPNEGLLQFFISRSISYSTQKKMELLLQQDYKIRYFPKLESEEHLVADFSYLQLDNSFLIQDEMKLEFQIKLEPVSATDYRFEEFMTHSQIEEPFFSEDDRTFEDIYLENFLSAEHKLGGYPYFIEYDTRKDSTFLKKFDTLLFQIISNDEQGIMYGDSGIIKFFINQQSLKNLDFSTIYFVAEQF
ncbi:MAG TPA: YwqG family protein [Ureibacillus sp.]|nr:YwqG family protein [Ureibacillus sp.]